VFYAWYAFAHEVLTGQLENLWALIEKILGIIIEGKQRAWSLAQKLDSIKYEESG